MTERLCLQAQLAEAVTLAAPCSHSSVYLLSLVPHFESEKALLEGLLTVYLNHTLGFSEFYRTPKKV